MSVKFGKLSKSVYVILGLNPGKFTLTGTNIYVIGTGKSRILIDAGEDTPEFYPHLLDSFTKISNQSGCTRISDILLTHRHYDHVSGIPLVIKAVNEVFGVAAGINVWKCNTDNENEYLNIVDGQEFMLDDAVLRAIYTPGHTDDHMSFLLKTTTESSLFSGDCILGSGTSIFNNLKIYLQSLRKLSALDIARIYPAHGDVIENGPEKINEYIQHRLDRENQIILLMNRKKGWSVLEIVGVIYPHIDVGLRDAACRGITLHLGKLIEDGKVVKDESGYSLIDEWKL